MLAAKMWKPRDEAHLRDAQNSGEVSDYATNNRKY